MILRVLAILSLLCTSCFASSGGMYPVPMVYQSGAAGASASDDFNRANLSNLGTNWTAITSESNLSISSNTAVSTGTVRRGGWYNATSFAANQCSQATMVFPSALADTVGLAVRVQSGAQTFYLGAYDASISNYVIRYMNAGTFSTLNSAAGSYANGDIMKVCVSGTTITLYKNGSSVLSTTDANISSGQPGLFTFAPSGFGFDDWSGFDI